jgi:hypothetical protein
VLVSYARLTEEPAESLDRLANLLGVPEADLVPQAEQLRPPRTHSVEEDTLPDALQQEATTIYEQLDRQAPL